MTKGDIISGYISELLTEFCDNYLEELLPINRANRSSTGKHMEERVHSKLREDLEEMLFRMFIMLKKCDGDYNRTKHKEYKEYIRFMVLEELSLKLRRDH